MRDGEAAAAEHTDADEADERVDAALGDQRDERVLEVLAAVGLLVHVLLEHRKVREREEDAAARDGELDRARECDHWLAVWWWVYRFATARVEGP